MRSRKFSIAVIILIVIAIIGAMWVTYEYPEDARTQSTTSIATSTASGIGGVSQDINHVYTNNQYGFSIKYPDTFEATTTFRQTYMMGSTWQMYADPDVHTGIPVIAFYKKNSNEIVDAEIRIGVSTSTHDVAACTKVPEAAVASSTVINGIPFIVFSSEGAGMMHFSKSISYRTVHNNTCLALDEFVTGTDPEVYEPPREVPFNQNTAWQELNQTLHTFSFSSLTVNIKNFLQENL